MSDETRDPTSEEPSAEEPTTEEPSVEELSAEEPTTEEPSAESPAEAPPAEEPPVEPSDTGKIEAIREALEAEEPADAEEQAVQPIEAIPAEMDMGPERRSNAWIWVSLIVAVLLVAGAVGYAWWYTTSRPVVVPDIVGKMPTQAVQILNDVGLRLGEVSEEMTDTAPPGTVLAQTPEALDTLKPGDSVSFVVAAPPATAKVPDVVGRSAEQAAQDLAKAELAAYKLELYDPNVADGFVISQLPSAGVELPPGANVALAVSLGPAPAQIRVPDLVGLDEQDAAALLSSTELRGAAYRSFDPSITAGEVIAQAPSPGTTAGLDGVVQYLVSEGPGEQPVTVPDVKGRTEADAKKALAAVPLKVQVKKVSHPSVPKGVVISQLPAAGSKTARNAQVGILVSKGNLQRVPAPDMAGQTPEDAEKAATSAGLTWLSVEIATSDHPAGLIFAQYPAAGTEWPLRFPIIGVIATAP